MAPTHLWKMPYGDGAFERSDQGLTATGRLAIRAMNRERIVIDLSGMGPRSGARCHGRDRAPGHLQPLERARGPRSPHEPRRRASARLRRAGRRGRRERVSGVRFGQRRTDGRRRAAPSGSHRGSGRNMWPWAWTSPTCPGSGSRRTRSPIRRTVFQRGCQGSRTCLGCVTGLPSGGSARTTGATRTGIRPTRPSGGGRNRRCFMTRQMASHVVLPVWKPANR